MIQKNVLDLPYISMLNAHKEILFFPKADICILDNVKSFHIYSLLYFFIAFVVTGLYLLGIIQFICKNFDSVRKIRKYIFLILFFCFFLLIILQQYSRYNMLEKDLIITKRSSEHEKNLILYKEKYDFPNRSKVFVDKGQKVSFYSDMDCNIDPCMYNKRLLKYFLYPNIILTENKNDITNYTLLFKVDNPKEYIMNKNNTILLNINDKIMLSRKNKLTSLQENATIKEK